MGCDGRWVKQTCRWSVRTVVDPCSAQMIDVAGVDRLGRYEECHCSTAVEVPSSAALRSQGLVSASAQGVRLASVATLLAAEQSWLFALLSSAGLQVEGWCCEKSFAGVVVSTTAAELGQHHCTLLAHHDTCSEACLAIQN